MHGLGFEYKAVEILGLNKPQLATAVLDVALKLFLVKSDSSLMSNGL